MPKSPNGEITLTCQCDECLCPAPPQSIPIRADVCSMNFVGLTKIHGPFDAILMDPPWQLAGKQPTRGVALAYSQLSDRDIMAMPVEMLSKKGFIFLWTINVKLPMALQMMKKWGYRYVQEVVWVKRTVNRRLAKCHGYYLQHAKETCLVGIKGNPGYKSTTTSDVIYTERRGQSQKPRELYDMIEGLIPAGKFLEMFGRRHNQRNHWVTIGNEL